MNYTDQNQAELVQKTAAQSQEAVLDTISQRLAEILDYQKSARRWAIFRGLISFLFFLIFVVLPIIGGVFLFRTLSENINVDDLKKQYEEFQQSIKGMNSTAKSAQDLMKRLPSPSGN